MPAPRAVDPLLRFYGLESGDARGRSLTEIWGWDDERLEQVHDYIQWLFPLREPSAFNPGAPVLTRAAISATVGPSKTARNDSSTPSPSRTRDTSRAARSE